MALPDVLQSLLKCPHCARTLTGPATLRCGHTICAFHLTPATPRCPLPACRNPRPTHHPPRIPSNISYVAPRTPPSFPILVTSTARDVTINKVLHCFNRVLQRISQPPRDDDDDDNDEDGDKRRYRRRPRIEEQDDLLAHLTSQAAIQRTVAPDDPLPTTSERDSIIAELEKELCTELSCDICSNVYYEPITTPCQHTFCSKCLQRSLDHQQTCPLCREELPNYSYFQDHPTNQLINTLVQKIMAEAYKEQVEQIKKQEFDAGLQVPLFICQLTFPGLPVAIHIFEPRYRLMLRRCLNSPDPSFGMVMPPKAESPTLLTDYGTMLQITGVEYLEDGRSLVQTMGTYRFRILARGSLDGYTVAKIERIDDYPDTLINIISSNDLHPATPSSSSSSVTPSQSAHALPSPSESNLKRPTDEELMETCRTFLARMQQGSAPWVVQRLNSLPPMPDDPALFSFWAAWLLPFDDLEKARLLPIRSPRLRLILVVHWIEQLNRHWYVKLIFISGYFRWVVWKAIEFAVDGLVSLVFVLGIAGVGMDRRAFNAAWKRALVGAGFPFFLLAVALWWAV